MIIIGKIAWKNILHKPLNSALCVILLVFGVGIISLLHSIQHQLEDKFEQDLKNIDLVVGAKGSPLQLILSAVYHLDSPTGNISLSAAQKIMNGPMVEQAIPLAYGDSFKGYRILGTTHLYIDKYKASLKEGKPFNQTMETNIGNQVAQKTGLKVGDTFLGTHGEVKEGHLHENANYTVVGILEKNNTVLDHLVLTNIESVWQVHSTQNSHSKGQNHPHQHTENDDQDKDITAVLLKFKTKLSTLTMPRIINQQTNMQAVIPALEINRLFHILGIGATTLKLIAGGIMLMAGLSVFFVLYNRLQDRKYELALMRSVGYQPLWLFTLLIVEGFLLAVFGYILGWLLSRAGLYFLNQQAENGHHLQFKMEYLTEEFGILLLTILVGVVAALVPAGQAMQVDVSTTLSQKQV